MFLQTPCCTGPRSTAGALNTGRHRQVYFDRMKTYRDEGGKPDVQEDENDPRSINYRRILVRPRIRWKKLLLFFVYLFLLEGSVLFLLAQCGWKKGWLIACAAALALIYGAFRLEFILVGMIRLYQRFAPEPLRDRCRFEPSCSQYMLLAIEKYGVREGVKKGTDRLRRCNVTGGGYDWP